MTHQSILPEVSNPPHQWGNERAAALNVLATLPASAHLTSREAAIYIGTTPAVLRVWRSTSRGPRFRGRGHFVRYTKSDLDEFMSGFDHRFVEPFQHQLECMIPCQEEKVND
jgi:hypothetical protein